MIKFFEEKRNIFLLIIVFSFLIYGNSLNNKYALDDAIVITQNDFVKKGFSGIKEILNTELFTGFFGVKKNLVDGGRYRPLSLISFAIEYELFGENPWIGHLINILFYALTGIVLYLVLLKLFNSKFKNNWDILLPTLATFLWLVHPLHTEVVANIKGRDEIFALLGSLTSLYLILKYLENKKIVFLLGAVIVFFLALLSKEMTITYLAIIPLSLYFFTNYNIKNIAISSFSLIIPTALFLFLRQSIMGEPAVTGSSIPQELMNHSFLGATLSEQFATVIYTLLLYIKLLFIPFPLTFDYYPYHIEITNFANPWVLFSILFHLGLAFIAIMGIKKRTIISFAIFYYAITFSIVSNILFPIGTFMSERFMYMPSIGWAIILAYGLLLLGNKIKSSNKSKISVLIIILILIPFSLLTINRNKAWENDYILFTTDVETSIGSAKSNTSAGGKIIEEVDKLEKILRDKPNTIKQFEKAINKLDLRESEKLELLNASSKIEIIRNINIFNKRKLSDALFYLKRAIKIHPTYVDALLLLGNAYYKNSKDFDNTWLAYEKILKKNPRHDLVAKNWTLILNDSIPSNQKIKYHQQLLKYNPYLFENNYQIGIIYGRQLNILDSSIVYLEKAKKLAPTEAKIYKDLGVAYGMNNQLSKALPIMLEAYKLSPNDPQILINIGVTYQNMGDVKNANIYFEMYNKIKAK